MRLLSRLILCCLIQIISGCSCPFKFIGLIFEKCFKGRRKSVCGTWKFEYNSYCLGFYNLFNVKSFLSDIKNKITSNYPEYYVKYSSGCATSNSNYCDCDNLLNWFKGSEVFDHSIESVKYIRTELFKLKIVTEKKGVTTNKLNLYFFGYSRGCVPVFIILFYLKYFALNGDTIDNEIEENVEIIKSIMLNNSQLPSSLGRITNNNINIGKIILFDHCLQIWKNNYNPIPTNSYSDNFLEVFKNDLLESNVYKHIIKKETKCLNHHFKICGCFGYLFPTVIKESIGKPDTCIIVDDYNHWDFGAMKLKL